LAFHDGYAIFWSMSYLNKSSLREEFSQLKTDYAKLSKNGKVSHELAILFKSMMVLLEVMINIFLEKSTKKNSSNSGIPSSQTEKDYTSNSNDQTGKKRKTNGQSSSNCRTKETVQVISVKECPHCGEDLSHIGHCQTERRTKIDIFFVKRVIHFDAQIKDCPTCHQQTKGKFPTGINGPLQYGPGVKAFVLNLLIGQMVAINRIKKMIQSLIGHIISEATILKYSFQLYVSLESWEKSCIEKILVSSTLHCDETSLRVNKKNHWIHSYSSGEITLKFLHKGRGIEAMEDINIIPRYGGTIIHDCWASYLSYEDKKHALCGSHLLRELKFIMESNSYRWAKNMKILLQETAKIVSKSKMKKMTANQFRGAVKRYRNILTRGEKEMPAIPKKKSGKKGRLAKSDAQNLLERLKKYEESVLKFAEKTEVPFTNNRAERDLRMSKVKQKVSGSFRTEDQAKAYCRISSYLQTMANRGYEPMIAIQLALENQIPAI
jgi:transposase